MIREYFHLVVFYIAFILFNGINAIIKPQIPWKEAVVKSGKDLYIPCVGDEPVGWILGERKFTYSSEITNDTKYRVTIKLPNVQSPDDIGFYTCYYKSNFSIINQAYVYIEDENKLALNDDHEMIEAEIEGDVIIPCKPTFPDVKVSLLPSKYESYDPKFGFTVSEVEKLYTCIYEYNSKRETRTVHVQVIESSSISHPIIEVPNNGIFRAGNDIVLTCILQENHDMKFSLHWIHRNSPEKIRISELRSDFTEYYGHYGTVNLTIEKSTVEDSGDYTCVASGSKTRNQSTVNITILDEDQSVLRMWLDNDDDYEKVVEEGGSEVEWSFKITAYPSPTIIWINNENEVINPEVYNHYRIFTNLTHTSLRIKNIDLRDFGMYQLQANNEKQFLKFNLSLIVKSAPKILKVSGNQFYLPGENATLNCEVLGYPVPNINWLYKICVGVKCQSVLMKGQEKTNSSTPYLRISSVNIIANSSQKVQCFADNYLGKANSNFVLQVTDVQNGFGFLNITNNTTLTAFKGDPFSITCAVFKTNKDIISWNFNGTRKIINNKKGYSILEPKSEFSYRSQMIIKSVSLEDQGKFTCEARRKDSINMTQKSSVTLRVLVPRKANIVRSNMNSATLTVLHGEKVKLYCIADGLPEPLITWTQGNKTYEHDSDRMRIEEIGTLTIAFATLNDSGYWGCKASNRFGRDERVIELIVKTPLNVKIIAYIVISATLFLLLLLVLYAKIQKAKRLKRELRMAGLMYFEEGALESLNPELGVGDQAELLPYDKKWEFPRHKLKLGKQLGSGAFGVVMKGEAEDIIEPGVSTIVAVKMVKYDADYTHIKALTSELKIMVHLGKHLNVVNLLGACSKNVLKRELLVIVEYCKFGNLHNYLLHHRDCFINQIDENTGDIDVTIRADFAERSYLTAKCAVACAGVDYRDIPSPSECNTETTCTGTMSDSTLLSNVDCKFNYKSEDLEVITTSDLLSWAFQTSRGMEYLASRKVLHGDLAARNILLAEGNIVKICDFGLAKSMYQDDNYKKQGEGPLPVKWLAIESIRDRIFSTQSDVWSFGIVLWEFFSLAKTPYPGMEADEIFYQKLVEGYRMDPPEYSTDKIYNIMMECWHANPTRRPSFSELQEQIGILLEDSVRKYYIDLNDPYMAMNRERLAGGQDDYLLMLSSPDYRNISSSSVEEMHYINEHNSTGESEYLCMTSPAKVSSPGSSKNTFSFEIVDNRNEAPGAVEMENRKSDVDSKVEELNKELLAIKDNYVNISLQKNILCDKLNGVSNPGYVDINKKTKEDYYVNNTTRDWENVRI